ncbi:circadian clock protein KaiC [Candidatus Chloroploca sp. Khr17]|uniref:circadian clock protein KaiC n=1 Tax=Candidatus Chloroploca sp. Khr17 TaxID=2496869 RepID=UPI00101D2D7D|nr:circadian clock protein KaiC [Candidatus Chloroploca sp. Khr17]
MSNTISTSTPHHLAKTPTGIYGIDEITAGGLPQGRPTLVAGSAGCGKTLLAMEFLVRGATLYNEPGVFVTFEESPDELMDNVASLGFDLDDLRERGLLWIEHIYLERSEIEEVGAYTLDGLFIRLAHAFERIGAKRVALDTLEVLFSGLRDEALIRAELRRLFRWLKERGVTAVVTAERGDGTITRHGLEEYVADCVIVLDHRVTSQLSTRRIRIVKYRGTMHGTNEYPFLIDQHGFTVFPITALGLDYDVGTERISTGVAGLDEMLGGSGYYKGSTVLISGTAGTGKTSLSSAFAAAACARGEHALFVAFEESPAQIMRNVRSIGIDLRPAFTEQYLHFHAVRPTLAGLELHLATITDQIARIKPSVVIIDPITSLISQGFNSEVRALFTRLIDFCKQHGITLLLTSLSEMGQDPEGTDIGVSSLVDSWLLVRNLEMHGKRNRGLYILKSRGMAHSNQIRKLVLSSEGISLIEIPSSSLQLTS